MLIKALKSTLPVFKQHFCENPSKLAKTADFVSQKKKTSFSRIFQKVKISKKKKTCPIFVTLTLTLLYLWTFLFLFILFSYYLWRSRIKVCYFLDFPKLFAKNRVKRGYCGHFGHLADFVSDSQNPPNV